MEEIKKLKEEEKKRLGPKGYILMIVLLIAIICSVLYIYSSSISKTSEKVETTKQYLTYNYVEESNKLSLDINDITDEETSKYEAKSFHFNIVSNSKDTNDIEYYICIKEEPDNNNIEKRYIKVALYDGEMDKNYIKPTSLNDLTLINSNGRQKLYTSHIYLPSENNEKKHFTLKYWIDKSIMENEEENVNIEDLNFTFLVEVKIKE